MLDSSETVVRKILENTELNDNQKHTAEMIMAEFRDSVFRTKDNVGMFKNHFER